MEPIARANIIRTLLSGFDIGGGFVVLISHILLFLALLIICEIPVYFPSLFASQHTIPMILSFFIVVFLLLIKLLHYLFDNEVENEKSHLSVDKWGENPNLKNENSMFEYLSLDVVPEYAVNLFSYPHPLDNEQSYTASNEKKIVSLFGHSFSLPFSRPMLERVFSINPTIPYILVSFKMVFASCYLLFGLYSSVSFDKRVFMSFMMSQYLFSVVQPPLSEPYSHTLNDLWNGHTRIFHTLVFCGLNHLIKLINEKYPEILAIDINYITMISSLMNHAFLSIPLLVLFGVIGRAKTTIHSLVETFNLYIFGQCGTSTPKDCFLLMLKNLLLLIINTFVIEKRVSSRFLLFPLVIFANIFSFPFSKSQFINSFIFFILGSIIGFFSINYVFIPEKFQWNHISLIGLLFGFCFDIILPKMMSNQNYGIAHVRFFSKIPHFHLVRLLISSLIGAPLCLAYLQYLPPSPWISSIVIIHSIQLLYSEPHVFYVAILISRVTLQYEFCLEESWGLLPISFLISRKLWSLLSYGKSFHRFRSFGFLIRIDTECFECNDPDLIYLNALYTIIGPDFVIKFPVVLWGGLTGSPIPTPLMSYWIITPYPIMPNHFWQMEITDTSIDSTISKPNHTVEKSVYTSVYRSLSIVLKNLIQGGRFGYVTNGDIFMFRNGELCAFVVIISNNCLSLKFQIRGLEYSKQTPCHRGENFTMQQYIDSYTSFPNFKQALFSNISSYSLLIPSISFSMYELSMNSLSRIIVGCPTCQSKKWIIASLVYSFCSSPFNLDDIPDTEPSPEFNEICNSVSSCFDHPNYDFAKIFHLYVILIGVIYPESTNEMDFLAASKIFNGDYEFSEMYLKTGSKNYRYIVKSIQLGFVVIQMASAQLAPCFASINEIKSFFEEVSSDNVITSMNDRAFHDAFNAEEKTIISISTIRDTPVLVRFSLQVTDWTVFTIEREFVRASWANETRSQMWLGELSPERVNIQENQITLNNMILQSCNEPIGYPGFISPIIDSSISFRTDEKIENKQKTTSQYT